MASLRVMLPYAPLAIALAIGLPVAIPVVGAGDAFEFWLAGHVAITGHSPYDQQAWVADAARYGDLAATEGSYCAPTPNKARCVWAYPPHTAWLFAPFALFEPRTGVALIEAFIVLSAVASLVALGRWMRSSSGVTLATALAACALSQPFLFGVNGGHFVSIGVIGFVALARGLAARSTAPVVLGALLLSLKPHLYVVVAIVVALLLVLRRDARTLLATGGVVGAVVGAGFAVYPEAVAAILHGAPSKTTFAAGTTWQLGAWLVPGTDLGVIGVFAAAVLAMAFALRWAPAERRLDVLLAASAAASIAFSFYIQLYDDVLTLPAFCLALALADALRPLVRRTLVSAVALALTGWTWLMVYVGRAHPEAVALQGALPLIVLTLLAACAWAGRRWADNSYARAVSSADRASGF